MNGARAPKRWRGRSWAAAALRTAICAVPVIAAALVGVAVARVLPDPDSAVTWFAWVAVVLGSGGLVGVAVERGARRLAPLAWLVRLSMVFPDQAPSRLGLALRVSSTKRLRAWLLNERDSDRERSAAEHAEVVLGLAAALGVHDKLTRGHCERVRALTDLVADELRLDEATADRLRWAALLHDIGKLLVPASLLNKRGSLTAHERTIVARHPVEGVSLAEPLADWLGPTARAIGEHHERFDGTGYPDGLAGHEISLAGRIVALTDSYDTMTSVRSYKRAMSPRVARAEVARCAGRHFDPVIARSFLDLPLPRLWRVVGPAAVLAQLPLLGATVRAATQASQVASLAAIAAIGSGLALATGTVIAPGAAPPPPPNTPAIVIPAPTGSGTGGSAGAPASVPGLSTAAPNGSAAPAPTAAVPNRPAIPPVDGALELLIPVSVAVPRGSVVEIVQEVTEGAVPDTLDRMPLPPPLP